MWIVISGILQATAQCPLQGEQAVYRFIKENMPSSVRTCPKDSSGHLFLPKPYSVPTITGMFQDMFYWDTYFTNLGLIRLEDFEQAKNNIDNILYLIRKLGFMPNASCSSMLNRSQPPYASMMVREIYEKTRDKSWLTGACDILETEYEFWMTQRITPSGLNRHMNSATRKELLDFYDYLQKERFPALKTDCPQDEKVKIASQYLSEAESGWDFTPRFESHCEDFNPIDLNANLYIYEKNFIYFYKELNKKGAKKWEKAADKRKKLINKYCYNPEDGLYYDYDYMNKRQSKIYSAAIFNLFWAGIPNESQAEKMVNQLNSLEFDHGIAACAAGTRNVIYQWDYPNAWASFNCLAVMGLDRYGYKDEAKRIAYKYVRSITDIYNRTGNLWEKFNAVKGNLDVHNEYEMSAFMGWTAGAFLYMADYLGIYCNHPESRDVQTKKFSLQ